MNRDPKYSSADGYLMVDDGISLSSIPNQDYLNWHISYSDLTINFEIDSGDFTYVMPDEYSIDTLGAIHILNAADIKDINFACYFDNDNNLTNNVSYSYNEYTNVLTLSALFDDSIQIRDVSAIRLGTGVAGEQNVCWSALVDPLSYQEMNPYVVSSVQTQDWSISTVIKQVPTLMQ